MMGGIGSAADLLRDAASRLDDAGLALADRGGLVFRTEAKELREKADWLERCERALEADRG